MILSIIRRFFTELKILKVHNAYFTNRVEIFQNSTLTWLHGNIYLLWQIRAGAKFQHLADIKLSFNKFEVN